MAKTEKRKKSEVSVVRWLEGYRRRRATLLALGGLGTLLLSIPVLFVTWWVIWLVLFLPMMLALSLKTLSIATWIAFGLVFVAYLTVNRRHLESLKFDEAGPGMVAAHFAAHVAGMSSLSLFMAGPETMRSQVKVISLLLLTGPSLIGLSWRLARSAFAALRMDTVFVGMALAKLLAAGRSVLVDELAASVGSPEPPRLLRELLLIDGVILLTSGNPSLTMTDSLRTDLSVGIDEEI